MKNIGQYNVSFRRELMLTLGQSEDQCLEVFPPSTEAPDDYTLQVAHLISLNLNGTRLIIRLTTFHITIILSSVELNEINIPNPFPIAGFSAALS